MPAYGTVQGGGVLTQLNAGDQMYLWNAETPVAGTASLAFARGSDPVAGQPNLIVFTISFATAPTDVVNIQGSNDLVNWETLYTSTSTSPDYYGDAGGFAFYRALLVSQSGGGAVTVIANR
jgi:hypothetical protein